MHKEKKRDKKLVLKIAPNRWEHASRDMRELNVVKDLGAKVLVMAKGDKTGVWDKVGGFCVFRMSTRPLGAKVPNTVNRFVSMFTWAYQARKFHPDIISGHDLIGLYIGWISSWLTGRDKPVLVYDSHEFTIYAGKKSNAQIFLVKHLERYLIKKCAFTIEVNDQIADEVQAIHKLKDRPVVVRNIPEKWEIDPAVCQKTRKEILGMFGGVSTAIILMYHGAVMQDRGIETLIKAVEKNRDVIAFILGNGEKEYLEKLRRMAGKLAAGRVMFHEAVPQRELWKYVGAADIGMILAPATCRNHLYSLPNKFFENIQSETPVICPSYPSMGNIMEQFRFGLTCNPQDIDDINRCIEKMRTDRIFYVGCKTNVKAAKDVLQWENEREILQDAYRKILV